MQLGLQVVDVYFVQLQFCGGVRPLQGEGL